MDPVEPIPLDNRGEEEYTEPRRERGIPVVALLPSKEAEVLALAQEMMTGLAVDVAVFPSLLGHNIGANAT